MSKREEILIMMINILVDKNIILDHNNGSKTNSDGNGCNNRYFFNISNESFLFLLFLNDKVI